MILMWLLRMQTHVQMVVLGANGEGSGRREDSDQFSGATQEAACVCMELELQIPKPLQKAVARGWDVGYGTKREDKRNVSTWA